MLIRTMWTRLQEPDNTPSGGGSATPSVTPSAAPASAPASSASSSVPTAVPASGSSEGTPVDDFDFGALVDNSNAPDNGDGAPPPKAAAIPPSAPPAAPTPPVAATPPVATPPVAATPPVQPAGQPPAPASQTPMATEGTPPEPFNVEKHRAEFLPKLESLYKMTDQEVADFQTNPGEALPKLAARLHYEVQLAAHQGVLQVLPHLINSVMSGHKEQQKHEDAFYGRWPELKEAVAKDPKNEASIQEAIRSYKALNPKAPISDVIEKAGLLALISMGIPPRAAAAMVQAPAATVAPATPMMPARPAGTGASAHVPIPTPGHRGEVSGEDLFGAIADHWNNG